MHKYHLLPRVWCLGIFILTIAACKTLETGNSIVQENEPIPEIPQNVSFAEYTKALSGIENAFAKENCVEVLANARKLGVHISRDNSYLLPTFAFMAVSFCESEASSLNKLKLKQSIDALEQAKLKLSPALDPVFIENLKSRRYAMIIDMENARKSKIKALELLNEKLTLKNQIENEVIDLSEGSEKFSKKDRTLLRDVLQFSTTDDKLFVALKLIEDISSNYKQEQIKDLLLKFKSQLMIKIEQQFAYSMFLVEEKLASEKPTDALVMLENMKQKFPKKNFEMRINAFLSAVNLQINTSTTGKPNGIISPVTTISPEASPTISGKLDVEKVFTDAKNILNSGEVVKAIELIDTVPEADKTAKLRRLRKDAVDIDVTNMRNIVREIYDKVKLQKEVAQKQDLLKQCKQILETILTRYPDITAKPGVERNLKSINIEIDELGKGK